MIWVKPPQNHMYLLILICVPSSSFSCFIDHLTSTIGSSLWFGMAEILSSQLFINFHWYVWVLLYDMTSKHILQLKNVNVYNFRKLNLCVS